MSEDARRLKKGPAPSPEIRLIGRLASDPKPRGRDMALRVVVTYGVERHERHVLAIGKAVAVARGLHSGDLVYIIGRRGAKGAEHEIEAEHVLALGPSRRKQAAKQADGAVRGV
jgi:hypothetical protein